MPGRVVAELDDRDHLHRHLRCRASGDGLRFGAAVARRGIARLCALDPRAKRRARHVGHAERLEHLAQHLVRRHVAVLELLEVRLDLGLDEAADRVADGEVHLVPLDHGADATMLLLNDVRRLCTPPPPRGGDRRQLLPRAPPRPDAFTRSPGPSATASRSCATSPIAAKAATSTSSISTDRPTGLARSRSCFTCTAAAFASSRRTPTGSWPWPSRGAAIWSSTSIIASPRRTLIPAAPEDAAAALAWTVENAERYGGNPGRIFLAGESAGANLITSLTIATSYERPEPWARALFDLDVRPRAVVPACGLLQVSDPARFLRRKSSLGTFVNDRISEVSSAYLDGAEPHVPRAPSSSPIRWSSSSEASRPPAHYRPSSSPWARKTRCSTTRAASSPPSTAWRPRVKSASTTAKSTRSTPSSGARTPSSAGRTRSPSSTSTPADCPAATGLSLSPVARLSFLVGDGHD